MKRTVLIAYLLMAILSVVAQDEDFHPSNPPEPLLLQQLVVKTRPAEAGWAQGSGRYAEGAQVNVSTGANNDYKFLYWELNGQPIEAQQRFTYTMTNQSAELVAVYEFDFNPANPSEPIAIPVTYRLFLEAQPSNGGYFNRNSGDAVRAGFGVYLTAYAHSGYVFDGWYDAQGAKIAEYPSFTFSMPDANTTLTARFRFAPDSPNDPEGNQADVDNQNISGDVNGDRQVGIGDIIAITNFMAGNSSGITLSKADVNGDGDVGIGDIIAITNIMAGRSTTE